MANVFNNHELLFCFSDVDECQGNHDCERICDNRIGTYLCSCPPGFELNSDNITCKGEREFFDLSEI